MMRWDVAQDGITFVGNAKRLKLLTQRDTAEAAIAGLRAQRAHHGRAVAPVGAQHRVGVVVRATDDPVDVLAGSQCVHVGSTVSRVSEPSGMGSQFGRLRASYTAS